jgi:threonine synthase
MGVIARWRDRLPVGPATPELTLGEGGTPLVRSEQLSERLGVELWFKFEGANPTGSFKDRGMCVAVAKAVEDGAEGVVCASTGNTAASAAAYAARAGLPAVVLTPAGAIAAPKQAQARAVGARVLEISGTFDDALRLCRQLGERDGFVVVNSLNPDRIEGQKSVSHEVIDQLGAVPDVVALPFGGGGNTTAVALGFAEAGASPRLVAGEARERATTWASAIRIADPAHADSIASLVAAGSLEVVPLDEEEIRHAWSRLAADEGVFCEPASAAGVAALERVRPAAGSLTVCIVTGHGLKDSDAVAAGEPVVVDASLGALLKELG